MTLRAAIALLVAHALACGGGSGDADAGAMDAFVLDAPIDAGTDASPDATDAGVDAPMLDDAGEDASCMCPMPSECMTFECVDGACIESIAPNGTTCGEIGICVDGACMLRGCGDGFREPGPEPPREACDDGNVDDGDACDSSCMPTLQQVAQGLLTEEDFWEPRLANPNHPSIGVDDAGNVLVVYMEDGATIGRMMGRRYDRGGVAMGEPFQVAPTGFNVNVVGLPEGWVVASTQAMPDRRVLHRRIPLSGVGAAGVVAERETSGEIALGRVGDGFAITWADYDGFDTLLYARRYNGDGIPMARVRVDTGAREDQHFPRLAGSRTSTEWAVVWESRDIFPVLTTDLVIRRFDEETPIDETELLVHAQGLSASVAYLEGGIGVAYLNWLTSDVYLRNLVGDVVSEPMFISDRENTFGGLMLGPNAGGYLLSYFSRSPSNRWVEVEVAGSERSELADLLAELEGYGHENSLSHASAPDGTTWFTWQGPGFDDDPDSGTYGVLLYGLAP